MTPKVTDRETRCQGKYLYPLYTLLTNWIFLIFFYAMRIAVVGCGGIGSVVAATLASKGMNVTCVELADDLLGVLQRDGIVLTGKKGNFSARVRAIRKLSDDGGSFDIIVIAVKSNALSAVFSDAKAHLCKNGCILTLQNGLEIMSVSERSPAVKVVAGAVGYNAVMTDPAHYLVTSDGGVTIGNLTCATRDDLFMVKSTLEPAVPVYIRENIRGVLWAKLLIVCGVTGLGGVSGLLLGKLLEMRVARKLFYEIVTEGALVAGKQGVEIEKLDGAINPERFSNLKEGYPLPVRWFFLKVVGLKYRKLKSNFLADLERRRRTEVDFLNGKILHLGKALGQSTPVNEKIVEYVKEIEQRKRVLSPENLREIWRALPGS
jgi:2-dehydropantoate 2-reductase